MRVGRPSGQASPPLARGAFAFLQKETRKSCVRVVTTTRTQLSRVSFWRNANAPRARRTCFPLANPATPSRILCPITFLRIERFRRPKTAANPEFLHVMGSFWIAPAPKMATTLRTPTRPKVCVQRSTRKRTSRSRYPLQRQSIPELHPLRLRHTPSHPLATEPHHSVTSWLLYMSYEDAY